MFVGVLDFVIVIAGESPTIPIRKKSGRCRSTLGGGGGCKGPWWMRLVVWHADFRFSLRRLRTYGGAWHGFLSRVRSRKRQTADHVVAISCMFVAAIPQKDTLV